MVIISDLYTSGNLFQKERKLCTTMKFVKHKQ